MSRSKATGPEVDQQVAAQDDVVLAPADAGEGARRGWRGKKRTARRVAFLEPPLSGLDFFEAALAGLVIGGAERLPFVDGAAGVFDPERVEVAGIDLPAHPGEFQAGIGPTE